MIDEWIVFCFILVTCGAQQHLTCMKTDEIIAHSPPFTDDNVQQGRPGRRGPRGPVGRKGRNGPPGLKGEPGISDNSVIDELRGKSSLRFFQRKSSQPRNNSCNWTFRQQ